MPYTRVLRTRIGPYHFHFASDAPVWDLHGLESVQPLVASTLHSERYTFRAVGILNHVDPLVSSSNYYIEVRPLTKILHVMFEVDVLGLAAYLYQAVA